MSHTPITLAFLTLLETFRRKDLYVVLVLLAALATWLAGSSIMGLNRAATYVGDLSLLGTWVASLVLTLGAANRQLPAEERRGTIFPLLAKPVTRWQLIVGKWLGTLIACSLATALFYLLCMAAMRISGRTFPFVLLGQAFLLHACALGIVAAAAIMFSTRLNADASLAISTLFILVSLLLLPRIPAFLASGAGSRTPALEGIYYILPHLELFDLRQRLLFGYDPIPFTTMLQLILYAAACCSAFLLLAWLAYRNKTFSRTAVE
jgi:hypothetical protein